MCDQYTDPWDDERDYDDWELRERIFLLEQKMNQVINHFHDVRLDLGTEEPEDIKEGDR